MGTGQESRTGSRTIKKRKQDANRTEGNRTNN